MKKKLPSTSKLEVGKITDKKHQKCEKEKYAIA